MTAVVTPGRRRGIVRRIAYRRPWVYPEQEAFLFTEKRFSFVEATTKSGKTTGCLIWLNELACLRGFEGWNGWWVAPVYGQAKIAYKRLKLYTRKLGSLAPKFNDSELTATYPNGAVLWFKSGEKSDNLYGEDVYAAVLDEASRVRAESFAAVVSTLTATDGPLRVIGNVKGRKNWFFKLCRKAEAGDPEMFYLKLTADHAMSAGIVAASTVETARRLLPPDVFRELYYAEAAEDGSNPFGLAAIRKGLLPGHDGITRTADHKPAVGPVRAFGVDVASVEDFTVQTGLNDRAQMAVLDRFQAPWPETKGRILRVCGGVPTLLDETGVGKPILQDTQQGRSNFTGYTFTGPSKQRLMEGLSLFIQEQAELGNQWLYAGENNVVLNELESFEYSVTLHNGRVTGVRYSAPEGQHDDTVCSLALAVEQYRHRGRAASVGGVSIAL